VSQIQVAIRRLEGLANLPTPDNHKASDDVRNPGDCEQGRSDQKKYRTGSKIGALSKTNSLSDGQQDYSRGE
jgi:hypothetical protein